MGKRIPNYEELPLSNKKVYDLVLLHTDGNVSLFADYIGVTQQVLDRIFKKDNRNGKYPSVSDGIKNGIKNRFNVNDAWFFLDENGDMQNDVTSELSDNDTTPPGSSYKLIPVIHIDSVGGVHSNNEIVDEPQFIEGYVPFVNARDGDKAVYQSGESMIPTVPPGSLMQIREVVNWKEYFGYGNIFVIELSDGRRITKEVNRYGENPNDYIWCKSHNPNVADEELPKNMIVSVWKVIKVLINKGW